MCKFAICFCLFVCLFFFFLLLYLFCVIRFSVCVLLAIKKIKNIYIYISSTDYRDLTYGNIRSINAKEVKPYTNLENL